MTNFNKCIGGFRPHVIVFNEWRRPRGRHFVRVVLCLGVQISSLFKNSAGRWQLETLHQAGEGETSHWPLAFLRESDGASRVVGVVVVGERRVQLTLVRRQLWHSEQAGCPLPVLVYYFDGLLLWLVYLSLVILLIQVELRRDLEDTYVIGGEVIYCLLELLDLLSVGICRC